MGDLDRHQFSGPEQPLTREGRDVMQAYVAGHFPLFVLAVVLIAQLLLLSFQITRNNNVRLVQVWTVTLLEPFERAMHWTSSRASSSWQKFRGLWSAQEENRELRAQLSDAQAQIQILQARAGEAESLRQLLEFKQQFPITSVAAEVIAASPGERARSIFINKGAEAGLVADLAVVTPEGAVGKVVAVFPHTAQVQLVTDPASGLGCMLEKTRVQGVWKGTGQPLAELHYIMDDQAVDVNDAVVTSGMDQVYPKGLRLGTVIKSENANIYKRILVKPAVDLDRLETVLVLTKSASEAQQAANLPRR